MTPNDEALEALESDAQGERLLLHEYPDQFGLKRCTLSRRWWGRTSSIDVKNFNKRRLSQH
jgi:hypothetical protein